MPASGDPEGFVEPVGGEFRTYDSLLNPQLQGSFLVLGGGRDGFERLNLRDGRDETVVPDSWREIRRRSFFVRISPVSNANLSEGVTRGFFVSEDGCEQVRFEMCLNLQDENGVTLVRTRGNDTYVRSDIKISPDSDSIAYFRNRDLFGRNDDALELYAGNGEFKGDRVLSARWFDFTDDERLVHVHAENGRSGLWFSEPEGIESGEFVPFPSEVTGSTTSASIDPARRRIAFTTRTVRGERANVALWSTTREGLERGEVTLIAELSENDDSAFRDFNWSVRSWSPDGTTLLLFVGPPSGVTVVGAPATVALGVVGSGYLTLPADRPNVQTFATEARNRSPSVRPVYRFRPRGGRTSTGGIVTTNFGPLDRVYWQE